MAAHRGWGEDSIYFDHAAECRDAEKHRHCRGRWRGVVSCGFDADGKRIRKKVSGRTKTEVREKLKELHDDLDEGVRSSPTYSVQLAIADWLEQGLDGRSAKTVSTNREVLDPLAAIIGKIPLRGTHDTPNWRVSPHSAWVLLADLLPGEPASGGTGTETDGAQPAVYGDAAYGAGELLATLEDAGVYAGIKVQPPPAPKGHFPKDRFAINLRAGTVTCPAGRPAPIRARSGRHAGTASFGAACRTCPLAAQCTTAPYGRTITIGPHETQLAAARERQADPASKAGYQATRPKVERKIGHLMRRRHGGRRARVHGQAKVAADFALLAAAINLARLAVLGLASYEGTWVANRRPAGPDCRPQCRLPAGPRRRAAAGAHRRRAVRQYTREADKATVRPGQVTGYAVGLPQHAGKDGHPVWYGGGKLADDLTLPKLRTPMGWAAGA